LKNFGLEIETESENYFKNSIQLVGYFDWEDYLFDLGEIQKGTD
jgi:hypothetical protein